MSAGNMGRWVSVAAACLALLGCPADPVPGEEDAGGPPPDPCSSLAEALGDPGCELALAQPHQAWLTFAGDEDWYSFRVPAGANARTLIHLTGGYAVPNTPVNLSVNLLREDGQQSLARVSDRHGQAAPRPVDLVLPFAEANARLVLLVGDDPVNPSRPNFDLRAPYQLKVEVLQDPDANEPNDQTPTPIALSPQGPGSAGTGTGYLSTSGDVDSFSFDVAAQKILYLAVSAPTLETPPPFRLSYELYDPAGVRISEGVVQNAYLAVNLATARRTQVAGKYKVVVKGYQAQGSTAPVPGDVRLQYTVDVRIFDEADASELAAANDTLETASAVALTAGQTRTVTGRLGSVPDPDWYRVELAPNTAPTVLYYRLRPGAGGAGRFPALPGAADRELRALRTVTTGGSTACLQDAAVCPKSFGDDPFLAGLVSEQCAQFTPPRCLWTRRVEHPEFAALRNFEGTLPIPPHAATLPVHLLVQDLQNDWADDVDYALELEWRADPDDEARYSAGAEQAEVKPLAEDPAASTFPVPPQGPAYELTGRLSHGHGFFRDHDPNHGEGTRAPSDYDAVSSDRDRFELQLPVLDPDAGYLDRTWEVEWEVSHLPDGGLPYDLALELQFCDGELSTAQCVPVKTASRGAPLTLSYADGPRDTWHNTTASERQAVYERTVTTLATTTTARAYGCFCLEPRFVKGGKMYVSAVAVDRRSYADTPYTIRTAYTAYPQTYARNDGGTASCPPPGPDAGCYFTYQP